jgi:hypothetical protein
MRYTYRISDTSQLFFGPKGTGTTLHCAIPSIFFIMIKGKKKWTFIDPKYSEYLSPVLRTMDILWYRN